MATMLYCVLVTFAIIGSACSEQCDPSKCNVGIQRYYEELGCRPTQERGECCPSKFDCGVALSNRPADKCHLNHVTYAPGATVTGQQVGDLCLTECRCIKFGVEASFVCSSKNCTEKTKPQLAEGCNFLYNHNTCCSTGMHCGTADTPTSGTKKPLTCSYKNKSYVVGQKFYPTEKPCKNCICQQGFNGTLDGPWCKDITCALEVHYSSKIRAGCAPIYLGQRGCCPVGWRCPSSKDSVVRAPSTTASKSLAECTFGNLRLKISDKLNAEKPCVECKCTVPPHVSCSQRGYC